MRRVVLAACALVLAGCGYDDTPLPRPEAAPSSDSTPAPPPSCSDDRPGRVASYAPDGTVSELRELSSVQDIVDRGRLIVGVAADNYLLGFRNTTKSPSVIEGFDIDMARAVAQAIFGDDDHLELRVITAAQRIPFLQDGQVDMVARNMTINCTRWQQIAFSAEYFTSGQKFLVRRPAPKDFDPARDLEGLRVCAPVGTTSLDNIVNLLPGAVPVSATNDTGCLVKFQNSETDALSTDDTVLAGLAAQDPNAVVPDFDGQFSDEPYGLGINAERPDLVRLVNAVLEQMRADGRWQASYDRWLGPYLGKGRQPKPVYGRALP